MQHKETGWCKEDYQSSISPKHPDTSLTYFIQITCRRSAIFQAACGKFWKPTQQGFLCQLSRVRLMQEGWNGTAGKTKPAGWEFLHGAFYSNHCITQHLNIPCSILNLLKLIDISRSPLKIPCQAPNAYLLRKIANLWIKRRAASKNLMWDSLLA